MTHPLIEWGVATVTIGGESTSGDLYLVKLLPHGALIAALDGIGHGPEAEAVAKSAVNVLDAHPQDDVIQLLRRCHEALRGTRGVVMSVASLNGLGGSMTWLGVGNVEGLVVRADPNCKPMRESLLLRSGVVGSQLPPLHGSILSLGEGDTIILATDGIRVDFAEGVDARRAPPQIAAEILSRHAKGNDDALVLVARYLGETEEP